MRRVNFDGDVISIDTEDGSAPDCSKHSWNILPLPRRAIILLSHGRPTARERRVNAVWNAD